MANLEILKGKLYSRGKQFTNFRSIDDDTIDFLDTNSQRFRDNFGISIESNQRLDLYIKALTFLGSTQASFLLKSFDERILFLIKTVDPNIEHYRLFLNSELMPISEIESEEDEEVQKKKNTIRAMQLNMYRKKVRNALGFFDGKLLIYEKKYFDKFLKNHELIGDIRNDFTKELLTVGNNGTGLEEISSEDFQRINSKVMEWISIMGGNATYQASAFQLLFQYRLLGVNRWSEKILFFVLAIDSNLDALRIYEEECYWDKAKKRIIDKLGFFNKDLLTIEREIDKNFLHLDIGAEWKFTKKNSD